MTAIAALYLVGTSVAFGAWQGVAAGLWFFGLTNMVAMAILNWRNP